MVADVVAEAVADVDGVAVVDVLVDGAVVAGGGGVVGLVPVEDKALAE